MLFNSFEFFIFFAVFFSIYWLSRKSLRAQNILLLAGSYIFYGWWNPLFLFLLAFSTLLDFFTGLRIYHSQSRTAKSGWLLASLCINLGFLFVFKYYNFFIESFAELLMQFGFDPHMPILEVVLPVGISFYTFHGISYIVDIYKGKAQPTHNIVDYSVFVSFFPLLVAGPIERANHLLPQVQQPRVFNYDVAVTGLRLVLWGLFKKVVVADGSGAVADKIFDNYESYSGSTLLIGTFFFAVQIYGDFSGYSDIARGLARLMGFDLIRNFAYPYFSRDIAEFWRRWHISLSTWFRDYVYIPLGGSKGSKWLNVRNVFVIFLLSGFWHGANWTFIAWGMLNALYFLPLLLTGSNRTNLDIVASDRALPSIKDVAGILTTFALTMLAWVFFRSDSIGMAFSFLGEIFSPSILNSPEVLPRIPFVLAMLMFMTEWIGRRFDCPLEITVKWPLVIRWSLYLVLVVLMTLFYRKAESFIYFQF